VTPLQSSTAAALDIDRVQKCFGEFQAVQDVSLTVPSGTILSLLGPSGCGKTTLLRMIAGLLQPTSGTIRLAGEDITGLPPYRRNIGMVFQNYALFPHMSVADNVGFGLKMQGISRGESRKLIVNALAMVQMSAMAGRYPSELSGGQQQRISLARAIVTRPRILLLDEPFGALDRKLREEMQIEVKQLQRELGLTSVFVTHDQEEALSLSDTVAVMRAGRVEQLGKPSDIFDRPTTRFVAEFFGTLNTVAARVVGRDSTSTFVESACGKWLVAGHQESGSNMLFAVRANDTHVFRSLPKDADLSSVGGVVEDVIYKGGTLLCRVRLSSGAIFSATAAPETVGALVRGDAVTLGWSPRKSFLFPESGAEERPNSANEGVTG
jgi:spermidine/putrescine ABC transporter ATP-binding subunit